ncbi:CbiQ family ECF transporter T component [Methylotenera sp. G11]|uniref:CbiQ family ECF transporter T component n=1 Tax=Methylotenera sp. G11 TaxID=1506585 RepID=UPI000647B576|nr:CbiQ family ECF transporter T component [Methylotenera sp. G11]
MHPFIKILCFIALLLLMGMVSTLMLFALMMLCLVLVSSLKVPAFLHAVKRMRWLFLSIFMIYAFGTPGELIPTFPVYFAPTYEGLWSGFVQIEKLLIALAALSLLLTGTPRGQMMLGLYMLLTPLKFAGLNIERFSARLMLTLDYVEQLAAEDKNNFSFSQLDEIDASIGSLPQVGMVSFQKLPFGFVDKVMMFLLTAIFVFMIYRGFA